MYGSSLIIVTDRPRDSRMAAKEAAAMPLPREETTPPVTNTYLVMRSLVMQEQLENRGIIRAKPFGAKSFGALGNPFVGPKRRSALKAPRLRPVEKVQNEKARNAINADRAVWSGCHSIRVCAEEKREPEEFFQIFPERSSSGAGASRRSPEKSSLQSPCAQTAQAASFPEKIHSGCTVT